MSDRAFRDERSAPSAPRAAERRNDRAPGGTEHRNGSGTLSLKALADMVLSRGHSGTPSGTIAERSVPVPPERTPKKNTPPERLENPQVTPSTLCPHVTDPDLAEWYAENPKLTCARCWLSRQGRPIQAEGTPATGTTGGADATRNSYHDIYRGGG